MPLAQPYASADDATVVDACLRDDPDAWAALRARYGTLVYACVVGALDGPRASELDEEGTIDVVWDEIREGALERWKSESQLGSYLALVGRHLALTHGEARTRPEVMVNAVPTPSGIFLDDLLAIEPATRIEATIEKLPPNIGALIRLRLRGLSQGDIAATLGMSPATVRANLERIATRLGDLDAADTDATWRTLLDAADVEERVRQALRSEDDASYRSLRRKVEKTWQAVSARALGRPSPKSAECLDEAAAAGFVDGTLRGAARARAEAHVASCRRCVDEAAALVLESRAQPVLKDAAELEPTVAVAAACAVTGRLVAAERLASRALERRSGPVAGDLRRIAQAGRLLEGGQRRAEQTSQVIATRAPASENGPLLAFEALAVSDPNAAWRAIDDDIAKQTLGARLRLLAAAAGRDPDAARELAEATLAQPLDPGHTLDARAVCALPRGRALPREILVERLRALLPAAVRFCPHPLRLTASSGTGRRNASLFGVTSRPGCRVVVVL